MNKRKRSSTPYARRAKRSRYTPQALSRKVNKTSDIPSATFDRFLVPFTNQSKITRIARHTSFSNIIGSNVANVAGGFAFTLADLPSYTELTALYDQYRIVAVQVKFIPAYTETEAVAPATSQWGLFYTAIDLDDFSAPSITTMRENPTMIASHPTQTVTRRLVPHLATAAYSGAFTSYTNKVGDWIDASSPSVQHYGIKYFMTAHVGDRTPIYNIEATYCIELRSVH